MSDAELGPGDMLPRVTTHASAASRRWRGNLPHAESVRLTEHFHAPAHAAIGAVRRELRALLAWPLAMARAAVVVGVPLFLFALQLDGGAGALIERGEAVALLILGALAVYALFSVLVTGAVCVADDRAGVLRLLAGVALGALVCGTVMFAVGLVEAGKPVIDQPPPAAITLALVVGGLLLCALVAGVDLWWTSQRAVPVLLLLRRARADLQRGELHIHHELGPIVDVGDAGADESDSICAPRVPLPAWLPYLAALPASDLVVLCNPPLSGWRIAEAVEVADTVVAEQPHTLSALVDADGDHAAASLWVRALSTDERDELHRHARVVLQRLLTAAAAAFIIIAGGGVWFMGQVGVETPWLEPSPWLVGALAGGMVATARLPAWLRRRGHAARGEVHQGRVVEDGAVSVVEYLPESDTMWTMDGRPAAWRTQRLLP